MRRSYSKIDSCKTLKSPRASYHMLDNLQLRYALDPWQVLTPEQNFTFFVPTNEAWDTVNSSSRINLPTLQVSPSLRNRMTDGQHWLALQYVYKRHILQGQALQYTDLRERTYVMMNDEKVVIRRRGRCKYCSAIDGEKQFLVLAK